MKERPIIFNTDMVRAILDGRKTQTRRPISLDSKNGWDVELNEYGVPLKGRITSSHPKKGRFGVFIKRDSIHGRTEKDLMPCPFGQPGDRLWVRETLSKEKWPDYHYWALPQLTAGTGDEDFNYRGDDYRGFVPSIHMPRWASRITLEITNIRVERVQDITEADAKAEGVIRHQSSAPYRAAFEKLIKSIYSPKLWDRNDWVWVIEFKRIEAN